MRIALRATERKKKAAQAAFFCSCVYSFVGACSAAFLNVTNSTPQQSLCYPRTVFTFISMICSASNAIAGAKDGPNFNPARILNNFSVVGFMGALSFSQREKSLRSYLKNLSQSLADCRNAFRINLISFPDNFSGIVTRYTADAAINLSGNGIA